MEARVLPGRWPEVEAAAQTPERANYSIVLATSVAVQRIAHEEIAMLEHLKALGAKVSDVEMEVLGDLRRVREDLFRAVVSSLP